MHGQAITGASHGAKTSGSKLTIEIIPDWGEAAQLALELLLPLIALLPLLAEIQCLQPLAKCDGLDINVGWCKS